MTMAKTKTGPAFMRFLNPVLQSLRDVSGTPAEINDDVLARSGLSEEELAASGPARLRNQIGWAGFYLRRAGLIESGARGEWCLSPKGRDIELDAAAAFQLVKSIREKFKRRSEVAGDEGDGDAALDVRAAERNAPANGVEEANEEGVDSIGQPYNPAKTNIITKSMSVEQLAKRIKLDEIDLAPAFQRKADLWTDQKKSRLIESMLIRIPLPVFYFDATDDNRWLVVDGLQRLSTIRHFMVPPAAGDALRLGGLEYLAQHEGKTFSELPRDLQRRIEETQVFAHLIQPGTPMEVKYNIFKRINTGGLVLTAQEIRHALYQKKGGAERGATHLLRELADRPEFLAATVGGIDGDRLLDCEFVLRFVSFSLTPYMQYTEANMDAFLNRHMGRLNDEGEGPVWDDLRRRFVQAMVSARGIFGEDAFRKRYAPGERRKPINKALFEVWSVALGRRSLAELGELQESRDAVVELQEQALNNDREFEAAISQGTGDVARVQKRFLTIEVLIASVLEMDT